VSDIVHLADSHNDSKRALLTPSLERQAWLELAVKALRAKFFDVGYSIPREVRFAIGWPKRSGSCGATAECWAATASSDAHREIFVSPELTSGAEILHNLAHELVHATDGISGGHGPAFKRCAVAVGLTGPMRSTTASSEFAAWGEELFKRIGDYPAGFLTDTPKQGIRQLKIQCSLCGYTCRVTRRWLTVAGPPICPSDRIPMSETVGAAAEVGGES
jgi:hypothetical protein